MDLLSNRWWLALLAVAVVYHIVRVISKRRRMKGAKPPPGPRGWPIVGNAPELAAAKGANTAVFRKWAKEHGPIVQFTVGNEKQVILSDDKVARDLYIKRSGKYSDRHAPHAVTTATMGQNPALRPLKEDGCRRERNFMQSAVSIAANQKYRDLMDDEATLTLHQLLQSPTPTPSDDIFVRYGYSVLTSSLMGFSVGSVSDSYVREFEQFRDRFVDGFRIDIFPSNTFPILGKLPSWLHPSLAEIETLRKSYVEQMISVRRRIQNTTRESIYKHFLTNRDEYTITDEEVVYTYQAMVGAGIHNPHDSLVTTMYLLSKHPEWQTKLQHEIDSVVGDSNRMPAFEDLPNLPTLRAIVKDGIRCRGCVREAGIPRRLEEDDIYEGYFFEKGTVFHTNFSQVLVDKEIYPDGGGFNPARYLDPSYPTYKEPLTVHPNTQNFAAFGYGRRACPGDDFGVRVVTIMLAKLAWAANILPPLDEGREEDEDRKIYTEYKKYRIEARNPERVKLAQTAAESLSLVTEHGVELQRVPNVV
ncbi:putative cytochrome P450 oxidoreductase [Truncatella angustata]|uniref:Cytochrome P450 oxidoreductase n=1 Tax=Truncatella angustata TaxID=152316 RepID=A0A9P8UB74_9PEZI|nr:putative cytochrome P450 oxidoreductase [Truncatella angustata]KAH6645051.1 putative cytochrome P450 oxidoreductase [Truncatella angustata]KAH8198418.1 hypothetical protein TruAng_007402 [Truncatella angustata]